jgi:hypothetical protein
MQLILGVESDDDFVSTAECFSVADVMSIYRLGTSALHATDQP